MGLRWAAAGMLAAEGQLRRVKGYQELPQLALALERRPPRSPACSTCPPPSLAACRIAGAILADLDRRQCASAWRCPKCSTRGGAG
jgi:hypothetical protein